jgi:hypothetical protein
MNNGSGRFKKKEGALPKMLSSGSCVRTVDMDGDGDLDLFVGGRVAPGEYPKSPRSYILLNDGKGNFEDKTAEVNSDLEFPGMVTDAIWTDFNSDEKPDLIVVGEWMPVRMFVNVDNKLKEITGANGISDSEGWWNSIISDDFDNDGDVDYVLGNFGLNSQLKASISEPVSLYVKDFDDNGSVDPILCSYIMGEEFPVFSKDDLVEQLNGLKNKYVSYEDYANEKITDIFSAEELKNTTVLQAKNFSSGYLENLGNNQFQFSALPKEVQLSPVYGMLSGDFNADGHKDILLGGNFFGTRVKFGRYDANKGTLLLGDGKGNFKGADVSESGLNINGEVRDIAKVKLANGNDLIIFVRNNKHLECFTY